MTLLVIFFAEGNADAGFHKSDPQVENPSKKNDYSKLIDTTFSIVDFVLKGVQDVGSNLPGIGVVSVVLAATDKLKVFN